MRALGSMNREALSAASRRYLKNTLYGHRTRASVNSIVIFDQGGCRAVPEESVLLDTAAQLCLETLEAFSRFQIRVGPTLILPNSFADRARLYVGKHYGPNEYWNADLVDQLTLRAFAYLAIGPQHVAALETLLRARPFGLPIGVLVRSLVEAAGRSAWLLDHTLDLRAAARVRVARLVLDQEDDARNRKSLTYGLDHESRSEAGRLHRIARNRMSRPGLFFLSEIENDDHGNFVSLMKQTLPSPGKFVAMAEQQLNARDTLPAAVYGYLSSMSHPSILAFAESLGPTPTVEIDGQTLIGTRHEPIFTFRLVNIGLRSFFNAWRLYGSWIGAGVDETTPIIDELNRLVASQNEAMKL